MPGVNLCYCVLLQAINAFVKQMSLSGKEFMSRKQLVDLVVSYHFIPGTQSFVCVVVLWVSHRAEVG
jgi:hypothetical protein